MTSRALWHVPPGVNSGVLFSSSPASSPTGAQELFSIDSSGMNTNSISFFQNISRGEIPEAPPLGLAYLLMKLTAPDRLMLALVSPGVYSVGVINSYNREYPVREQARVGFLSPREKRPYRMG